MNGSDRIRSESRAALGRIAYLSWLLGSVRDYHTRTLLLQELQHQVGLLQFLLSLEEQPAGLQAAARTVRQSPAGGASQAQAEGGSLPLITREQLAAATGRSGNPAYVAVNGIVYDVTDQRGWSAATHFGLAAGRDLSQEFASCHSSQQWILSTLKPVGRLP